MINPTEKTKDDLTTRARAEFREMPGMCLTTAQAARLWQLLDENLSHEEKFSRGP